MTIPHGAIHRGGADDGSLTGVSNEALARELLKRLRAGAVGTTSDGDANADLYGWLALEIEQRANAHANRMSLRNLVDVFRIYQLRPGGATASIAGKTVVELGCGSANPFGRAVVYVLLGAKRAVGIDLDTPQDMSGALRMMARTIAWLSYDPRLVIEHAWYPITRREVLDHLDASGIDTLALWNGDQRAIGPRLEFVNATADDLPFADGEVDFCVSNSFFEHVGDVERVIAETARILRPNAYATHNIDGTDHAWYETLGHPLAWLTRDDGAPMVSGCNRIRPLEYLPIFERHGFEVLGTHTWRREPVSDDLRRRFVSRFRDLPQETLENIGTVVYLRKR